MNNKKRCGQTEPLAPWLLVIMLIFIVIIAIVAYLKVTSLLYDDKSKTTQYALHSILESTDCAPNTKLPLRDVLAIGIGEGKTNSFLGDVVQIEYGGKTDSVKPVDCFGWLMELSITTYDFYVEHSVLCPPLLGVSGCYGMPSIGPTGFNVLSFEYIALPNGDVAKVVLKTRG
ncbi:MAG: hypothetical protein ABIF85_06480 [Nanoarchaeota archaeon]